MPKLELTEEQWEYLDKLVERQMEHALDRRNVLPLFERGAYGPNLEAHCRESLSMKLRCGPPLE